MKNLNLYLIRHGQTEWNIQERMQGFQNSELTFDGVEGAKKTGQFLKEVEFISAYSSDLKRARETRDYILEANKHINTPRIETPLLREMNFGIWEGLHLKDLKDSDSFNVYLNQPHQFDAVENNGETYFDALERLTVGIHDIVESTEQDEGNILIVAHGTVLRLYLNALSGGSVEQHRNDEVFPRILNTSISIVNYQEPNGKGQYTIKSLNDVSHIK